MGEVAVLRPQDLFSNRHHNNLISPALMSQSLGRRYSDPAPTANKHRSSSSNSSNRRKRSPPKKNEIKPRVTPRPTPTPSSDNNNNNNSLVMGQFKLLKRGETLPQPLSAAPPPPPPPPPAPSSKDDNKVVPMMKKQQLQKSNRVPGDKKKVGALLSADGMGPDLLPKQIRFADCYAGSACVSSPPPSSLPLPAFFKKKNIVFGDVNTGTGNEDNATSDLLRLLRLDLS